MVNNRHIANRGGGGAFDARSKIEAKRRGFTTKSYQIRNNNNKHNSSTTSSNNNISDLRVVLLKKQRQKTAKVPHSPSRGEGGGGVKKLQSQKAIRVFVPASAINGRPITRQSANAAATTNTFVVPRAVGVRLQPRVSSRQIIEDEADRMAVDIDTVPISRFTVAPSHSLNRNIPSTSGGSHRSVVTSNDPLFSRIEQMSRRQRKPEQEYFVPSSRQRAAAFSASSVATRGSVDRRAAVDATVHMAGEAQYTSSLISKMLVQHQQQSELLGKILQQQAML